MRAAALSVKIMDFASLDHDRLNVRRKALGLGIIMKTTTKPITLIHVTAIVPVFHLVIGSCDDKQCQCLV